MDLLELLNDKIDSNQEHLKQRLTSIDDNLTEHMRRTELLEISRDENTKRIVKLEEPRIFLSTAKKVLIGLGSIAGSIYAILKVTGVL